MEARFTIDGSEALESRLSYTCQQVLSGVQNLVPRKELEALVLGGGYGRGHGGVLKTESGDEPYNDMEFYVFIRGNALLSEHRYGTALRELGERLSPAAGLHVEFKVYSVDKLRRREISMFTYDLAAGHKTIFGDKRIFEGCEHHLKAERIPLHEATRLIFNRCSGLLLAKDILCNMTLTREDVGFIERNLAKAQLALGDAVLAMLGRYHWDCRERHERLNQLAAIEAPTLLPELRRHHACGVKFKLRPFRSDTSKAELERQLAELANLSAQLWLWMESRRLNRTFASVRDYALACLSKCPESAAWRNCLLSLRTFGSGVLRSGRSWRYPRERLFDALCLLLWDGDAVNDPALRRRLRRELRAKSGDWPDLVLAYRRIWQNYG
ncbi:MAG: hypothetical protein JWR26_2892 [Pedosphaera sp.]|nr:hypothetical protein [Pedosphaera sp.]